MISAAALLCLILAADVSSAELRLEALLDEVQEGSPAVVAARQRAQAWAQREGAAGAWSDPFVAVGPDEYTLGIHPPVVRYQLAQTVPLPGKLSPRVDVARARTQAAQELVSLEQRRVALAATQLFLRGLWLDRALQSNAAQRVVLEDLVHASEARYAAGAASAHHDVLLAQAERAVLARDGLALERERSVLLDQLDELRGLPAQGPARRLIDGPAASEAAAPALEDALTAQPELLLAQAALSSAQAQVRAADVAGLPDLVVQAMAMQSFMEGESSNVGAMVGLSVPLFFPWKQQPERDAARTEQSAVDTARRALELRLRAEWQEAERAEKSAQDTLALYEGDILPATAAAVESSKNQYATQGAPIRELLGVLRAQAAVELERFGAALDVRLARARLRWLLSSPPLLQLSPSAPTLFPSSMGGSMGSMPSMGRMEKMRATGMGPGIVNPSLDLGEAPGGSGMSGMSGM